MEQLPRTDMRIIEEFNFGLFWQQHGSKIVTAAVVLVAIGVIAIFWQKQASDRADAALEVTGEAVDLGSLERVANEFAGKQPAARALLRMGDLQFRSGRYVDAANTYKKFHQDFPRHMFAETAELGLAASQESLGDFASAKLQYQQLAATRPTAYTAIAARLGAARCMEGQGSFDEARRAYEELLPAVQGTAWQTETYLRWVTLARSYLATHEQVATNAISNAVSTVAPPGAPARP